MLAHTRTNKMEKRAMPDRGGFGGMDRVVGRFKADKRSTNCSKAASSNKQPQLI